jgi:hypothetical protein
MKCVFAVPRIRDGCTMVLFWTQKQWKLDMNEKAVKWWIVAGVIALVFIVIFSYFPTTITID